MGHVGLARIAARSPGGCRASIKVAPAKQQIFPASRIGLLRIFAAMPNNKRRKDEYIHKCILFIKSTYVDNRAYV